MSSPVGLLQTRRYSHAVDVLPWNRRAAVVVVQLYGVNAIFRAESVRELAPLRIVSPYPRRSIHRHLEGPRNAHATVVVPRIDNLASAIGLVALENCLA